MRNLKLKTILLGLIILIGVFGMSKTVSAKEKATKAVGTGTITAVLFEDLNTNSKQDPGEPGIPNIVVRLLDDSGNELRRTVTDKNGRYTFDQLLEETYRVKIDLPVDYKIVSEGKSGFNSNGLSNYIFLEEGEVYTEAWVGFLSLAASLKGTVFNDENRNGEMEATEKGLAGITLGLYLSKSSALLQTVETDSLGNYSFTKIKPNETYEVKVISLPSKYKVIKNKNFNETGTSIPFLLESQQIKKDINLALAEDIPATDIIVEPMELVQYVGDKGTLKVTFVPENAIEEQVYFSSVDPTIMTVDAEGNWEAKKVGSTMIIVTTPTGKIKLVRVTVKEKDIPLEDILVEPKVLDQYVGDKGKLKVTFLPSNASDQTVSFTSADSSIMTVDGEGNWEAKKVGQTMLIVSTGKIVKIVPVTVRERDVPVENITVEPSVLDQYVGDKGTLKVTITPDNASDKKVTFTSDEPSVMTVDAQGNWEAKKVGQTTITVTASNGKTATVKVTVREKEVPVENITVEPSRLDQYVGDKGTLKVIFTPTNATDKKVTFTSLAPSIMTVDAEGNWEAKAVGTTTIIVMTSNGKIATVPVTVKKKISNGVGVTYYDYPKFLGYFIEKGTGTATNFDDDYNEIEPYPGLGNDQYKIKKVGYVTVKDTGRYTFSIEIDDNGTVYLDDEKIIDRDSVTGGTLTNFRYLKAGQTIKIVTEHYNKAAPISYFHLKWQTPSNPYSPKSIPDSEIMMDTE